MTEFDAQGQPAKTDPEPEPRPAPEPDEGPDQDEPTEADILEHVFKYHPPTQEQIEKYQAIRGNAKALAISIARCCPNCADRSAAIRKVREAAMTANAAIALEGFV